MELARITAKGQMTIPKKVRDAAHLTVGDVVTFVVEDDRVSIRKVVPGGDEYLRAVQGTLGEWNSPEDEEAWRGL
jgi:antitoxin PrlF